MIKMENDLSKIKKELEARGASNRTINSYLYYNQKLLEFTGKTSNYINRDDINFFLSNLKQRGLSNNTLAHVTAALKFYYQNILGRKFFYGMRYPPRERKLPTVLTKEEIKRMIEVIKNPKHKLIIELTYGSGLRVSEIIKLKTSDLNLDQGIISVKCGKRRKDRNTIIPKNLIEEIKLYLKSRKDSKPYLFPGLGENQHLSVRSVQKIVKHAAKLAGINKRVYVHALRHSFATHLLESGVDIKNIAELLGHNRLDTTMIYLHTSTAHLKNIRSPLESL